MQVYTAKLLVRLRAEWSTNTQHAMYMLSGCLLPPAVMHNAAKATSSKQQGTVPGCGWTPCGGLGSLLGSGRF